MAKTAIVTLVIGGTYLERWNRVCRNNWSQYAEAFGHELVVVGEPLDRSTRASSRSAAWQKCLLFEQERFQKYDQVAWIDSDVLFNVAEPRDIIAEVPRERVGAVDSFADPSPETNALALKRLWDMVSRNSNGRPIAGRYTCPQDVYGLYGPPVKNLDRMINSGVFVLSPACHAPVLRYVYDNYEDRGTPSYYENVPLSYELVCRGLVHWLDPRFNHLWAWSKLIDYPFLQEWSSRTLKDKILRRLAN